MHSWLSRRQLLRGIRCILSTKTKLFVILGLCLLLPAQNLFAWNGHGHRVIASIAFLKLSPESRLEIAARIKNHPRWESDFASRMPDLVKAGDEQIQAEWIFQQAACWPDTTRGLKGDEYKRFNHSTWHYINLIDYLNPKDTNGIDTSRVNLAMRPPSDASELYGMNAVQAIQYAQSKITNPATSREDDALMICWLLHVYSDIHQPLHTTALFSKTLLPKGCRGGNSIKTKQGRNLHSLWDGLLGKDNKFQACHNQAVRMLEDANLASLAKRGASVTDAESVCRASNLCCKEFAYATEVRAHLQRLEDNGETKIVAVDLSDLYLKRAGSVAEQQASRAGWRLAKLLSQ